LKATPAGLLHFLQQVPDPRGRKGRRHPLTAMLAVIVASMMCRFDGYESAADWIRRVAQIHGTPGIWVRQHKSRQFDARSSRQIQPAKLDQRTT